MAELHPLVVLGIGMATVVGLIVGLRLNAFLALICAALVVSLLAPGEPGVRVARVAEAFGRTAGSVGIVIALAAIIGWAMMASGAADRIVQMFTRTLGETRTAPALLGSGFVLSVPVFFDTVFFLLLPLARSAARRAGGGYLKFLMVVAAGAAVTHTLVPPTPGPLIIADNLGVDVGVMLMVGVVVALPAAAAGLGFAVWLDRRMPIVLPAPIAEPAGAARVERLAEPSLPPLGASLLPVLLPVALIAANTVLATLTAGEPTGVWVRVAPVLATLGNVNLALLLAAVAALWVLHRQRRPGRSVIAEGVEQALMSAGLIILITAAGGAFGAMLQAAGIGPAIEGWFRAGVGSPGLVLLGAGFAIASLLKIAQGSSTVAMIAASAMVAAMLPAAGTLGFHPVYLATAIASGALVGSWMNDSGFWIYTKMGGLTELEALRSWTPLLALLGVVGMTTTVVLALLVPLM